MFTLNTDTVSMGNTCMGQVKSFGPAVSTLINRFCFSRDSLSCLSGSEIDLYFVSFLKCIFILYEYRARRRCFFFLFYFIPWRYKCWQKGSCAIMFVYVFSVDTRRRNPSFWLAVEMTLKTRPSWRSSYFAMAPPCGCVGKIANAFPSRWVNDCTMAFIALIPILALSAIQTKMSVSGYFFLHPGHVCNLPMINRHALYWHLV